MKWSTLMWVFKLRNGKPWCISIMRLTKTPCYHLIANVAVERASRIAQISQERLV